jgi:hypothetical protein
VLECLLIWQLLQVQHLRGTPLILVGEMWPGLVQWARSAMLGGAVPLASAGDLDIPACVANADQAIRIIREHHDRWLRSQKSES